MPIDTSRRLTPGWWLQELMRQLSVKKPRLDLLNSYFVGDCPLPEGAQNCKPAYRDFQRKARSNFSELVVEAVRERMMPVGFRTGAEGDEFGDKEAWRIWQANSLDADSMLVHRDMLAMGDSYVIVGGPDKSIGAPLITTEDPRQVITAHDPMHRRRVVAAAKVYHDDLLGLDLAYLYMPGFVFRAYRENTVLCSPPSMNVGDYEWSGDPQGLPSPVVPVVRFANRADNAGCSHGEFETVVDVLDRINFMVLQRLVITAIQAFKQRGIKGGTELPENDANGDPIDYNGMFTADPGSLWMLPAGAEIWESDQVELQGILSAAKADIQDLAAITRTPLFYLTPDAANGSAEGASLAREGLIFKTGDRIAQTTESWEQVMTLAFLFNQDPQRAKRSDMEVLWAPPERFTLAERYDAASKAGGAGVPWRTVMSDVLQFSPQAIERMEAERAVDALLAPQLPQPVPASQSAVPSPRTSTLPV